ncbi:MAG: thiamine-phosphate kinase [Chloroflexota bacterium]
MDTIGTLGEFGLIARLAQRVDAARLEPPAHAGFRLLIGIGDDAAAWRLEGGVEVGTTDTAVAGVHFPERPDDWAAVGWKLWAANVSDVIAMGGMPLVGLVTLGLPGALSVSAVDALYDGMLEACAAYRTLLVGGDVVSAREPFITVAMTGVCTGPLLRRDEARLGDAIAVAAPLGGPAGGLRLQEGGVPADPLAAGALRAAFERPAPVATDGRALVAAGVACAMDISDGLVADLSRMCAASGVGGVVEAGNVPLHPALAACFPDEALSLALGSGEEYRLLFTAPPSVMARALASLPTARVVGRIEAGSGVRVMDAQGAPVSLAHTGWEHLR